ncbi:MAG: PAS domain S-box protein [Candidatus Bathyarchaeia archaeon]
MKGQKEKEEGKKKVINFQMEALLKRVSELEKEVARLKREEEVLRETYEKYRIAVEFANDSILLIQDERAIYRNPAHERLVGYSVEETRDRSFLDLIAPEDREIVRNNYYRRIKGEALPDRYEVRILTKDGKKVPMEINPRVITYNGRPATVVVMRDITERKEAEEALRRSEERYRSILEGIEEAYYEVDLKGNIRFFNDRLLDIHGYTRDEFMGMNYRQFTDPHMAKRMFEKTNEVYRTGMPAMAFDWEIIRKDGTKRQVEGSISLMKDEKGNPSGFHGIMRDVTEKREREAEIRKIKDFLQKIVENSVDGIVTTDIHGRITFCSQGMRDISGYEPHDIIGRPIKDFYGRGMEDAKAIMRELTEKGELKNCDVKIICKDGSQLDILLSASLLRDEDGKATGTLGILKDITERKRLEVQLRQAQRMEAIGTLAGGIAHDFNNLLMGIGGNASLVLMEMDPSHPHYERLKTIERLVQMGSRLTSQLLGYARKGRYEVRRMNLNSVVEYTSEAFGRTRKDIEIRRDLAGDLFSVMCDQGQMEQVLFNLYVNAADAMPHGGFLFLRTRNVTHEEIRGRLYEPKPGSYVLLEVRDTGVGMDESTRDRIFEPFFTTKEMGRGTGLGLASVYGIVKGHGGYIEVESEKGMGSAFMIYLPALREEGRPVEERALEGELLKGGGEAILVVDDEEMVLGVCSRMLEFLGYRAIVARTGREAVERFRGMKGEISLVILDMIMPGLGGGETYDLLREIDPGVKVILSSGYSLDGQATEILERGCAGFIQKPFDMKDLSRKIREVLDKK